MRENMRGIWSKDKLKKEAKQILDFLYRRSDTNRLKSKDKWRH